MGDNFLTAGAVWLLNLSHNFVSALGTENLFWIFLVYSAMVQFIVLLPIDIAQFFVNRYFKKKLLVSDIDVKQKRKIGYTQLGIVFGLLILRIVLIVFSLASAHSIEQYITLPESSFYMLGMNLKDIGFSWTPSLLIPIVYLFYGIYESFFSDWFKKYREHQKMKKTMSPDDYELYLEVEKDAAKAKKEKGMKVSDFLKFLFKLFPFYIFAVEIGMFRYISLLIFISHVMMKLKTFLINKIQKRKPKEVDQNVEEESGQA